MRKEKAFLCTSYSMSWACSHLKIAYLSEYDKKQHNDLCPSKDSDQPGHPPSLISVCCPPEEGLGS